MSTLSGVGQAYGVADPFVELPRGLAVAAFADFGGVDADEADVAAAVEPDGVAVNDVVDVADDRAGGGCGQQQAGQQTQCQQAAAVGLVILVRGVVVPGLAVMGISFGVRLMVAERHRGRCGIGCFGLMSTRSAMVMVER